MIRELKTFIVVAQEGTFAAAANKIGLTQAAVSAQMKRLEEALGTPLFERQGRLSRLNTRGHELLGKAQELLALYAQLGTSNSAATVNSVTLGAIASIQRMLLPDILARFHRQHPDCRSRVVPGVSMELVDQVDTGKLDMAILIRPPFALQADLHWHTLAHEPFHLLVPKRTHGSDWRALLESQPFVRYDRASFGGRQVERFLRQQACAVREVCEVDELDAILRLVANGVGVALVPHTLAFSRWPAQVRALPLGEHTFYRDVGLIHRPLSQLSTPARALAELIAEPTR
ncbi:LysR substrate-binding domain-containing protein [Halomonas dongshanensis]|uniref:LysR family transcriptional regulator n=1 Tax=Halomonas dongshanensis TaxID=2890835 RepID=A0ABT2EAX7_9GAMM|nr:LysR substrate-binding domain-containing protein [Halomonas dongshanensis]MCS2608721.1 LysR family transcriptional regulator [Halomonas dongshanensis]